MKLKLYQNNRFLAEILMSITRGSPIRQSVPVLGGGMASEIVGYDDDACSFRMPQGFNPGAEHHVVFADGTKRRLVMTSSISGPGGTVEAVLEDM